LARYLARDLTMSSPILITRELARRLEAASRREREAYLELHRALFPERAVDSRSVGGALAVICGSHPSGEALGHRAFSRCVGLGINEPVTASMMDEIEVFYAQHGVPPRIDCCPLADRTLVDLLRERGYGIESFYTIWVRRSEPSGQATSRDVHVTLTGDDERDVWRDTIGRGFADREDIGLDPIAHTMSRMPSKLRFLARIDGEPAGAAAAVPHDSVALINGASTRVGFRKRGVQQALLAARIDHLAGRSEIMTVSSSPGSASERNIARLGFQVAYTTPILLRAQ
jgi:hypothetical protein